MNDVILTQLPHFTRSHYVEVQERVGYAPPPPPPPPLRCSLLSVVLSACALRLVLAVAVAVVLGCGVP
jgi:hypothetical protein